MELQSRLSDGILLAPDRRLIKHGELQKVSRKELQPRYFALVSYKVTVFQFLQTKLPIFVFFLQMNDTLFVMIYNGSGGTVAKDLRINYELKLCDVVRIAPPEKEDYPFEFKVITVKRSFSLVGK